MAPFSSILSYLRLYNQSSVKSLAQRRCLITVCWADLSSTQLQQRCCPLLYCVLRQCTVLSQEPLPSCNGTYQLKYVNISPPTGIHRLQIFSYRTNLLKTNCPKYLDSESDIQSLCKMTYFYHTIPVKVITLGY